MTTANTGPSSSRVMGGTILVIAVVALCSLSVAAAAPGGAGGADTSPGTSQLPAALEGEANVSDNGTTAGGPTGLSVEGGATASGVDVTVTQVRRPEFPDGVTVYAQVENDSGGAVTGLDASDFTVTENGTDQPITDVTRVGGREGSDVSTALTIDRSGSMSGSKLDNAEEAARDFVNRLSADDEGLVISFSSGSRIDERWTRNNTELIQAIDYSGGGGTDFYGSAVRAVKQSDSRAGRSAVVALTDGNDNGGTSLSEAISVAQERNVPIYTIGLGSGANEQALQQLASGTGGQYYNAPSAENLDSIYEQISRQIDSEYRITYEPTNTATDGTIRNVEATAAANSAQDTGSGKYEAPCAPLPTAAFSTDRSGQTISFDASGSSANGGELVNYQWDFTNDGQVDANGVTVENTYDQGGPIEARLTVVKGCGATDRTVETVNPSSSPNKPIAALGSDRQVFEGNAVNLDARGSSDPNGDPLSFSWQQTAGPTVQFKPQGDAIRSFLTPDVDSETTLSFQVTVDDNNGSSDTTSVDIVVEPTNAPPTAEAGPDQQVAPTSTVTLNGTASTDPDGDPLQYTWTQTDGPKVRLNRADTAQPTFQPPPVRDRATLTFNLSVSDGPRSDTDSVAVTVVSNNDPPTANISLSPTPAKAGVSVTASAQGSSDPDNGIETYSWSFGDGSTATGKRVSHAYSDPGTYTVELTVTDPVGESNTTSKDITIEQPSLRITDVSREIGGAPLEGVEIDEEVSATVESDAQVADVTFKIAGETYVDRSGSDGWKTEIDLEKLDSDSILTVTATTVDGQTVTEELSIPVAETPGWVDTLISVSGASLDSQSPQVSAQRITADPDTGRIKVRNQIPNPPVDTTINIPDAIPVVGGPQKITAKSKFGLTYDMLAQEATVGGKGQLGFDIFDRSAKGKLGAEGTVSTRNWNLRNGHAFASLRVDAIGRSIDPKIGALGVSTTVQVEVTVTPKIRLDIFFDNTPSGLEITRGIIKPGIKAKGLAQTSFSPGFGTTAYLRGQVTGDLTGQVEVPKPYAPGARVDIGAEFQVKYLGQTAEVNFPLVNKGFGSLASGAGVQLAPNGTLNISSDDWKLAEKYSSVPSARTPGGLSVDGNPIGVAASGSSDARLTRDRVADQSPAMGYDASSGTTTVVWSRQSPDKSTADGHDIYVSSDDGNGWSQPTAISDDGLFDTQPSLAVDGTSGRAVAVWSRVDTAISPDNPQNPTTLRNETEIVYAVREDGEWSAPKTLTDNAVADAAPTVAYDSSAGRWQLAWQQASGDIRLAQASDFTVGSNAGFRDRTTTQGSDPALAAQPDGGFTLAYFKPTEGRNGTVVFQSRSANGNITQQRRVQTTGLRDIAIGGDTAAWVDGPAAESVVHSFPSIDGIEQTVDTGNVSNVQDITLASQAETTVLTYRGQTPGEQRKQVYYALKRGDSWLDIRPLTDRQASNLSYWQLSTTVTDGGDRFRSVFLGQNVTARQNNDVLTAEHVLRPDVSIEASADNATVGSETRVTYTMTNTGDLDTRQQINVSISAGSSVIDSRTVDRLDVDGSRTGSFTVDVPESGTLAVTADTAAEELTTRNNGVVVTPDATDLAIGGVDAERDGDNATVEVSIANTGGATDQPIEYTLLVNNTTVANGTLSEMDADTTRTVAQTVPFRSVSANQSVSVVVDPSDRIAEGDERNNALETRLLRPDITVWEEGIEYQNATDGVNVTVWVGNEGPSATPVTVTIESDSGAAATRTVNISGVDRPNATAFEGVQFSALEIGANEDVTVIAQSPYEQRVSNNGLSSESPFGDTQPNPSLPGVDRPATDIDGDRRLEDINGDGRAGLFDALAYYNNRNSEVIETNPGRFDFDGDGNAGTLFDALALYNDIQ